MKKIKVLLAGALVLALGLVMGCSQNPPTTDDTVGKATENGWIIENQKNSTNQYWRWMRGTGKKYEKALIQLDMTDATAGKIGFVFGLSEGLASDGKGNGKWSYYQFGIGIGKVGTANAGKLEYYVDYYQDVDLSKVSGGSNAEGPEGVEPKTIVAPTVVNNFGGLSANELKVFVQMLWTEENGYELKIGPTETTVTTSIRGYLTEGAKDSKGKYMASDVGYYAMLTKASEEAPVSSTFKYTLMSSGTKTKVSIGAAEEE